MLRFGFSAYLKLICLSERRQRSELRKRRYSTEDAYDYHRSLRLRAQKLLTGESPEEVLASVASIKKEAERKSAREGLEQIIAWRKTPIGQGMPTNVPSATYTSPNELFRVTYTPDFAIDIGGEKTAVHVWNTMTPELQSHFVHGTLALFPGLYEAGEIDDLALLSLRDLNFYRLSDVPLDQFAILGSQIAQIVERRINEVWSEDIRPSRSHRPPAAPPAA